MPRRLRKLLGSAYWPARAFGGAMRRREFITLLGGAAALPIGARAQHQTGLFRRIGYLGTGSAIPLLLEAFRQGLHELNWVEGKNIVIDYRFAEGQYDRLPGLV